ncbi:RsmB/NOP family class I SAM-dependent RNA methyltransferase [Thermostaphylospora chromogena]|uniref:16S rRNA (Cytosine967-C5)-methyltransferase n=1 Tax=Thermostaphylospora chromogena TaxID=35622 RepID=A0A1H1G9K4_9ACTN|nr:transcription antitermination factor NusB [Thermostaphylospora chromogena]SDR09924.1 16S rRNA (cytosine967-C5)-methyltransferase [Thermostaphylospora chromogena]
MTGEGERRRHGGRPGRGDRRSRGGRRGPARDLARTTAFDVLRAVDERDAYANLLLPHLIRERRLSARDAGLATELAYGTLRGMGTYDAIIAACSDRPPERLDPPLLDALRIGAHQLLRTRVPAHAAVGTTVDLVRLRLGAGPSRYANAVLRKIATRSLAEWLPIVAPDPEEDAVGNLAVSHSHPRWIVSALKDALHAAGPSPDAGKEIAALLEADNERPKVTLVARPGRATAEELIAAGAEPAAYSPYAAYLPDGDPAGIAAVAEGRAAVQDEASQMVALALTRVPVEGGDARWLDMCAGPGGKAALLDGLARERGARLIAADAQYHRARLVWNATREAKVITADGTAPAWRPAAFDRVMLDAPCTGLGALRRRPEARWRRDPASLPELTSLQRRLLRSALEAVRPGGVVAYVTCSPHIAETRVVVEDVLKDAAGDAGHEVLDARAFLPEVDDLGPGPYAQFWPHRHGTDAMFLALLRRGASAG